MVGTLTLAKPHLVYFFFYHYWGLDKIMVILIFRRSEKVSNKTSPNTSLHVNCIARTDSIWIEPGDVPDTK